jgi:LacI family transcriptional regulator
LVHDDSNDYLFRRNGFIAALQDAGHGCRTFAISAAAQPAPEVQLERWLADLPKPVAIFATTDGIALNIIALCRTLQFQMPESVSVLGVGNDEIYCNLAKPSLSSICLPDHQIGEEATRMLDHLLRARPTPEKSLLLPPVEVIPRQSTDLIPTLDPDLAAAVRYIASHAHRNIDVSDILRAIPISRRALEQRFRSALGRSPAAEIRRMQIEIAKRVLVESNEPVSRVAIAAGFGNTKRLAQTFRRETGVTPSLFRQQRRRGSDRSLSNAFPAVPAQ